MYLNEKTAQWQQIPLFPVKSAIWNQVKVIFPSWNDLLYVLYYKPHGEILCHSLNKNPRVNLWKCAHCGVKCTKVLLQTFCGLKHQTITVLSCYLQHLRSTEGLCGIHRQNVKVPESWVSGGRVLRKGPWNVFFRLWADPRSSPQNSCFLDSPCYYCHTISAAPVYLPHPTRCISDMICQLHQHSTGLWFVIAAL